MPTSFLVCLSADEIEGLMDSNNVNGAKQQYERVAEDGRRLAGTALDRGVKLTQSLRVVRIPVDYC